MLFRALLPAVVLAAGTMAAPTPSQLPPDGFPNPSTSQLKAINEQADGEISNAAPPPSLNASSVPVFQLIEFNENFEVAFFQSLISNITDNVSGFQIPWAAEKASLLNVLGTILAQEQLHAISAGGVLTHFGAFAPPPCTYKFPTTNLTDALALANTFTSVVLGTLQDGAEGLATNGDHGPVRTIASVIGQEGEQNGFFRSLLNRKPSEKPFLTTSVGPFAFSALQDFVVSCPFDVAAKIPIPIFPTIRVLSGAGGADVAPADQNLTFVADLAAVDAAKPYIGHTDAATSGLYVTYLTGQNVPISQPVTSLTWEGSVVTFEAAFPFAEYVMDGLSIAALTTASGFANADALPAKTLAAPGLIQVNDAIL